MSNIINKSLLAKGNFMPEMHFRQLGFTYGACETFPKTKEEHKNSKKQMSLYISTVMN